MELYSIILFLISIFNLIISFYSLRHWKAEGSLGFSALLFFSGIFSIGAAFVAGSTDYNLVKNGLIIESVGVTMLPALLLYMTSDFTGHKNKNNILFLIFLFIVPALTIVVIITNPHHQWLLKSIEFIGNGSNKVLKINLNFWYWLFIVWSILCTLLSNILFLKHIKNVKKILKTQAIIMFVGSMLPWISYFLDFVFNSSFHAFYSPIIIALSGLFFAYGIYYYRLLDLYPASLENVFNNMQDASILIDLNKRIVNFNKSATLIFPNLNDDWIGREIDHVVISNDGLFQCIDKQQEESFSFESGITSKQYFIAKVSRVFDTHNKYLGKFVIIRNITSQKEAEKKLEELNNSKDKFLSIVAHDLKNPFSGIMGLSQIVLEKNIYIEEENLKDIAQMIMDSSQASSELLDNLFVWSQSQTGKIIFAPQIIKIEELINSNLQFVELLARQKNIILSKNIENDMQLFVDKKMMDTVLRNLLTNAIKFTPNGGAISVRAMVVDGKSVISIKDNGVGIECERLDLLFRADMKLSTFGTNGEKGTGLGLLLCKEFVDLHKGEMVVNSMPGLGTIFKVIIPNYE